MEGSATITVEQVQDTLDAIAFQQRYKTDEAANPSAHADFFLDALLSPEVFANPVAYKILQYLANFVKDGLLEKDDNKYFDTVEEMFALSNSTSLSPAVKTSLQEIATGLFSHACNALQGNTHFTITYLKYLLKAMLREGGNRWTAYSCCGPLLMTRLEAFQPHAALLLEVMLGFPETLSVIHDLYQLAPTAFVENMALLVKLYESNFNGQLSILDIVRDLSKQHPEVVSPHLAALLRIANGAGKEDVAVVKEIETTCASKRHVIEETQQPSSHSVTPEDLDGPEDFDERVDYLNKISAKCRDVPSLREFLRQNENARRYLRHVGQVMPLPSGIDYGINTHEPTKAGSNSKGSSLKLHRDSIKTSKENVRLSKDSKQLLDKDDFITLRFTCAANGSKCITRTNPIAIRTNIPPPWLKLAAVLYARSPPSPSIAIHIKKYHSKGDSLDALLEIAQSVELAAAAKREGGGGKSVDGFEVLTCPFLGTDDLGDLIVDLRAEGLFGLFHLDVSTNTWTCAECSSSSAQKATMSGYLVKKGRRLGREVKRFYMLDEQHMLYTANDRITKPKRRIPIADLLAVRETSENISFALALVSFVCDLLYTLEINVRNQKRVMVLHTTTPEAAEKWLQALQAVISEHAKSNKA